MWRRVDEELAEESTAGKKRSAREQNGGRFACSNGKKYDRHYRGATKLWSLGFFCCEVAPHSLAFCPLLDIPNFRAYYRSF